MKIVLSILLSLTFINTSFADSFGSEVPQNLQESSVEQEIWQIEQMYYQGEINSEQAEALTDAAYGIGGGFFVEINGIYYVIEFSAAYKCVKSVAKSLGCLVMTRSVSCLATEDAKEVVKSCQLKRVN